MKTTKQLIAQLGINEAHAVRLLNRRARYALTRDRPKFYASSPAPLAFGRKSNGTPYTTHDINADMLTLKLAADNLITTAQYVAAWCRLNHLLEC